MSLAIWQKKKIVGQPKDNLSTQQSPFKVSSTKSNNIGAGPITLKGHQENNLSLSFCHQLRDMGIQALLGHPREVQPRVRQCSNCQQAKQAPESTEETRPKLKRMWPSPILVGEPINTTRGKRLIFFFTSKEKNKDVATS